MHSIECIQTINFAKLETNLISTQSDLSITRTSIQFQNPTKTITTKLTLYMLLNLKLLF